MSRTENKRQNPAKLFCALAISAFISCFIYCPIAQAADLSAAEVQSLDGLETRFFAHTYKSETSEARLDRLEKLVYGEARNGDQDQRLTNLVAALPKSTDFPADPTARSNNSSDANQTTDSDDNSQSTANADPQTADNAAGDAEDYPTVDAIEQTLLGKSFQGQPIAKRLDQLELKAFNKTSQDPDLSERVSKLSEYVQKHMHKNIDQLVDPRTALNYQSNGNAEDGGDNVSAPAYTGAPGGSYGGGNYGGTGGYGGGSGSYGMNPPQQNSYAQQGAYGYGQQQPPVNAPETEQVAWLESRVFGRTQNPNVPLIDRLHRLEQSVFPTEQMDANTPISAQIKLLVNAVELMHNSNPGQPASSYGYQQASNQSGGTSQYPYQQSVTQNEVGASSGSNFPSWPPQGGGTSNQYSQYSANAGQSSGAYPYQNAPGTDGSTTQYEQQLNQMQQPDQQQQQQQRPQQQGHPLLKGLAHALMSVGTMAAGSTMMMNSMGGYGGYGGGYGGYGNYGTGMMPGYGGLSGIGRGFGGIHF